MLANIVSFFLALVFVAASTALIVVPGAIIYGFVLVQLWGWFLVPLGLPVIDIGAAAGITMIVRFIVHPVSGEIDLPGEKKPPEQAAKWGLSLLRDYVATPAIVLLFGYVFHIYL